MCVFGKYQGQVDCETFTPKTFVLWEHISFVKLVTISLWTRAWQSAPKWDLQTILICSVPPRVSDWHFMNSRTHINFIYSMSSFVKYPRCWFISGISNNSDSALGHFCCHPRAGSVLQQQQQAHGPLISLLGKRMFLIPESKRVPLPQPQGGPALFQTQLYYISLYKLHVRQRSNETLLSITGENSVKIGGEVWPVNSALREYLASVTVMCQHQQRYILLSAFLSQCISTSLNSKSAYTQWRLAVHCRCPLLHPETLGAGNALSKCNGPACSLIGHFIISEWCHSWCELSYQISAFPCPNSFMWLDLVREGTLAEFN